MWHEFAVVFRESSSHCHEFITAFKEIDWTGQIFYMFVISILILVYELKYVLPEKERSISWRKHVRKEKVETLIIVKNWFLIYTKMWVVVFVLPFLNGALTLMIRYPALLHGAILLEWVTSFAERRLPKHIENQRQHQQQQKPQQQKQQKSQQEQKILQRQQSPKSQRTLKQRQSM